jgi:signal transduction histidine kinase
MAEADIKSVLETNYQSPELGDRRGIGLLVVKRIIDIYHGTLTVESTPGHGTLFQIEFPE